MIAIFLSVIVAGMNCGAVLGSEYPAAVCPPGWLKFETSCYGFSSIGQSWAEAQAICKAVGARLAEVETSAENEFLKRTTRNKRYDNLWLGATDLFSEGTFVWASNQKPVASRSAFTDFSPSQPDNYKNKEHCMHLWGRQGHRWNDIPCTTEINFACEKRLP